MTSWSWRGVGVGVGSVTSSSLQWGHDLVVMESLWTWKQEGLSVRLQWGHDLVVMESVTISVQVIELSGASMGP